MNKQAVLRVAKQGGRVVYTFAMDEVIGRFFGLLKIKILLPVLFFSGFSFCSGFFFGWFVWG